MTENQTQHYKDRLIEVIRDLDTLESITINFTADDRNTFYQIEVQGRKLGAIDPDQMKMEVRP